MIKHIIFTIILVSLLSFVFLKKNNETYNEIIKLKGDFYIPDKDSVINFNNNTINSHKICVYDDSGDIECIDAETLITVLNLPDIRKTQVCIDDICINQDDIKVMNGTNTFKIKSKNNEDEIYYDKCLSVSPVQMHLCGESTNINMNSLIPGDCNEEINGNVKNFKFQHGENKDSNLKRSKIRSNTGSGIPDEQYAHHD